MSPVLKSPVETRFVCCCFLFHWLLLLGFEVLSIMHADGCILPWELPFPSFGVDVYLPGNIIYFKNLSCLVIYMATLPWLSCIRVFSSWTVRVFFLMHMCVQVCMCVLVEAGLWLWVLFLEMSFTSFEAESFICLSSPVRLDWLTGKCQGTFCLSLTDLRLQMHTTILGSFTWVLSVKLRSSCL